MKNVGLVLAGGKSSRMGSDKAKLKLNSRTLLESQVALLQTLLPSSKIFVSGCYDGFDCIPDLVSARGPIGGIYSVLQKFTSDDVLIVIVPVDMPLLKTETLVQLLEHAEKSPHFDAYNFTDFEMPLLLRNSESVFKVVSGLLSDEPNESRVSVRSLLREIKTDTLFNAKNTGVEFDNLNTKQDFERAVSHERQDV